MFLKSISRLPRAFAAAALLASAFAVHAAADWRSGGPLSLLATVKADPADRPALRQALQSQGLAQYERWKQQGSLRDYRVLFSRYADAEGFDALVQLDFADTAAVARWKEVEAVQPAGLPKTALKLVRSITTVPTDRMLEGRGKERAAKPVYLLIPYDYFVSTDEYAAYLDGYVKPQLDGWVGEGVVSDWSIHFSRYPAGRIWAAMFLIAYRDDAGLAARDATVAKVRARLAQVPEWKALAENKQKIRVERAPVVADELTLPR